jgi:hypothetical protein
MKICDVGGEYKILSEEIEITEVPDDSLWLYISEFIDRHQQGSQWPRLTCQETGGIGIRNGGNKSWIIKKQEWDYTAG